MKKCCFVNYMTVFNLVIMTNYASSDVSFFGTLFEKEAINEHYQYVCVHPHACSVLCVCVSMYVCIYWHMNTWYSYIYIYVCILYTHAQRHTHIHIAKSFRPDSLHFMSVLIWNIFYRFTPLNFLKSLAWCKWWLGKTSLTQLLLSNTSEEIITHGYWRISPRYISLMNVSVLWYM